VRVLLLSSRTCIGSANRGSSTTGNGKGRNAHEGESLVEVMAELRHAGPSRVGVHIAHVIEGLGRDLD
jgi:hypothetical protein